MRSMVCGTWGRPTIIDDRLVNSELLATPLASDHTPHNLAFPVHVDCFNHLAKLYNIAGSALALLYASGGPSVRGLDDATRASSILTLEARLNEWTRALPPPLAYSSRPFDDRSLLLGDPHQRAFLHGL